MAEKIVKMKRIVCDVCGHLEVVEVDNTLLSRPKTPVTWGFDLKNQDQLCPSCKDSYTSGYEGWYNQWKNSRKGKGKQ